MGVLWSRNEDLEEAEGRMENVFGQVHLKSETVAFEKYTNYYEKEMGKSLRRCFCSFNPPFQRGALVEAKLATNRIERNMSKSDKRVVNLDPGLLTLEALSLATTKPYYHRLYLSKGVYGELTLIYRKGGFEPLPWTYPDYREEWARVFFHKVREDLLKNDKVMDKQLDG